jgi:hypothetical protein
LALLVDSISYIYRTKKTLAISVADPDDFRPDPVPDQNIFSDKFLLEIFLSEICSKKYTHEQNS